MTRTALRAAASLLALVTVAAAPPATVTPMTPEGVASYDPVLPEADYITSSCPATGSWCRVQSSLFPLYDRSPQTFVPNIFFAKASDYRPATQKAYYGGATPSGVLLPIVP